jgi:hypothetical protein
VGNIESRIGHKVVINRHGQKTDIDEYERKQRASEKYKNIKVNALKSGAKNV